MLQAKQLSYDGRGQVSDDDKESHTGAKIESDDATRQSREGTLITRIIIISSRTPHLSMTKV